MFRYKPFQMAVLAILTVFIIYGCSSSSNQPEKDRTTKADVGREVAEALDAIKNYSAEKKDDTMKSIGTAMDHLDSRIDSLERRIDRGWDDMSDSARKKARANLKSLKKKQKDLSEWSDAVEKSSAKAWEKTKKGFMDSYDAASDAFDKAINDLKE